MASISERYSALHDVTVLSIGSNNPLALFRSASLELTADEIDMTALRDDWKKREMGTLDWRVTCSQMLSASTGYWLTLISGTTVVVRFTFAGGTFLGTGMITGSPLNIDNPMTQDVTIVQTSGTPTIT